MNTQQFYRKEYKKLNNNWEDSLILYKNHIQNSVFNEVKILDVGCGHIDFLKDIYLKTESYGIDLDEFALNKNEFIKYKEISDVEKMPFKDNFFDIVICSWVFEHLENPEFAIREIYRVLKFNGKIIFITPNVWNYNVWIIRLIPEIFHDFLTKKLYNRQEKDTYSKRYKLNSLFKIKRIFSKIGFVEDKIILNGDPSYISFNKFLFICACLIEKILNFKFLNFAKVHIIGIFIKR